MSYKIPKATKTTSANLAQIRWEGYLKHALELDRRYGTQYPDPITEHRKAFERHEENSAYGYRDEDFNRRWEKDTRSYNRIGIFNAQGLKTYLAVLENQPCEYDTEKSTVKSNRLWSVIQLTKTYPKNTEYELFVSDDMTAYKIVVGRNNTIIKTGA